ncbi:MAG: type II secretion system protein [Chloroflexi bacterium]|nr:MAG: type II secretion system protein [Chloroflexota bacterium]TMD82506.1 MAG: type II secretion system protein [Chloroflexota bacterium]
MTRRQHGFTLVEAMVGVAIFTVLSLAMAGTFLVGYRAISNEARVIAADTAVSNASLWLTRDLNSATTTTGCPCTIQAGSPLTLTYGVPPVAVVYSVDGSRNLIRTVGASAQASARGITSVSISWAGCYGTVTIQPSATGASAVVLNVSNRPGGCI